MVTRRDTFPLEDTVEDTPVDLPFDDAHEVAPDEFAPSPLGPALVCLSCGQLPPRGGDCDHRETARVERPSEALLSAARRLAVAWQQRRRDERALRSIVLRDLAAGGEILTASHDARPSTSSSAPPSPPGALVAVADGDLGANPSLDHVAPSPLPLAPIAHPHDTPGRRRRRRLDDPSQVSFSFSDAPTEPAPIVEPVTSQAASPETIATGDRTSDTPLDETATANPRSLPEVTPSAPRRRGRPPRTPRG